LVINIQLIHDAWSEKCQEMSNQLEYYEDDVQLTDVYFLHSIIDYCEFLHIPSNMASFRTGTVPSSSTFPNETQF